MILVQTTDFESGENQIAQTIQTTPLLQTYIDRYEEIFIKQILGVDLGQLFIDDIQGLDSDSSAIEDRFEVLIDPLIYQTSDGSILSTYGIKDILCKMIFFEYVTANQARHTQSGVTLNQSEVSTTMSPESATRYAEAKWNDAVGQIRTIQYYCSRFKSSDYPEYNGIYIRPKYSALL